MDTRPLDDLAVRGRRAGRVHLPALRTSGRRRGRARDSASSTAGTRCSSRPAPARRRRSCSPSSRPATTIALAAGRVLRNRRHLPRARALGTALRRVRPDRPAAGRRRPRLARGAVESVPDDARPRGRGGSSGPRRRRRDRRDADPSAAARARRRLRPPQRDEVPRRPRRRAARRRRLQARGGRRAAEGVPDASGIVAAPDPCALLLRGLETLEARVRRQTESATELARRLQGHPAVQIVRYPGIGGLLSFDVAGADEARHVETSLQLITNATSLGGVHSLMESRALGRRPRPARLAAPERRPGAGGGHLGRFGSGPGNSRQFSRARVRFPPLRANALGIAGRRVAQRSSGGPIPRTKESLWLHQTPRNGGRRAVRPQRIVAPRTARRSRSRRRTCRSCSMLSAQRGTARRACGCLHEKSGVMGDVAKAFNGLAERREGLTGELSA